MVVEEEPVTVDQHNNSPHAPLRAPPPLATEE